jgi:hypothetical protein
MSNYTIDFQAWTTVEAGSEDEAFVIAQRIISEIEELVANHLTLSEPFEMVVGENGVQEEEEL